jgi:O-acetyl-ADP-ribose deacetylase (regulator of RNase III)
MQSDQIIGQTRVQVIMGDIRTEPSDALITAINSEKMWFGGIDGAIQSVAGDLFHAQAAERELHDLMTVVATGGSANRAPFQNVVFVVDDLVSPLRNVVKAGLEAANQSGLRTVTIPGIRLGVMLGVIEKTLQEAYEELEAGTAEFLQGRSTSLRDIKFVMRD